MRTAPAPNILPLPGMNPCEFLMAGGAGSGGGSDSGDAAGDDKEGAGTGKDGKDAEGDQKSAPDYEKYPTCGTESHPVDVVTGRVFTHPITDLTLPGPLPFEFERSYSTSASKEDQGLGYGWGHSLGWFIEVHRRRVTVWNHRGVSVDFPIPEVGHSVLGDWGWVLRRDNWGYAVDANDDVWRVFSVTYDEGKTFRLAAIDDRNKNRIAITYDDGKLVEVVDSTGRVITFTSTREGRIASILVKNAEHQGQWIPFARYEYDKPGRLVRVTDADDYSWTYEYDEFNRLTCDTDRVGLSFCFKYDEKDRGVEAWGEYRNKRDQSLADDLPKFLADGRTRAKGIYHRKFEYHENGYTEVTDTTETRRYFGNKKGTLDKAVTGGAVTTSKYDERGFEIEKTDPMGATWRWVRDERGRVVEEIDPLERRTVYERDAYGLPIRVIDPAGGAMHIWRDSRGNPLTWQDQAEEFTQYSYDERGFVISIIASTGNTTRYAYDSEGNVLEFVQANGGVWHYTYDYLGRQLSTVDPTGAEARTTYSPRGDLLEYQNPLGGRTQFRYDGEGRLIETFGAGGNATRFRWGGFHSLAARLDANGHAIRFAWNREGELVGIYNELEEQQQLTYDSAGMRIAEKTFDGRQLRFRNDLAGRVVRAENGANEVTELVYDCAGQLVERLQPDGSTARFEYDLRGDLVMATSGDTEIRFLRDALGRVVREVQTVLGEEHWVATDYGPGGERLALTTSFGHVERIERDEMGARRRTWLDGQVYEHRNDVLGREVGRVLPARGIIETYFDRLGRVSRRLSRSSLVSQLNASDEPIWLGDRSESASVSTSYTFDGNQELISVSDLASGVIHYTYDAIGQLLGVVPERAQPEMFRFDPAGNVFETGPGAPGRTYGPGGRLQRRGETQYLWDNDGRLVEQRERTPGRSLVWRYAWNGAGLLANVELPNGTRLAFTYDALGRRVEKRILRRDGLAWQVRSHTRFVWDGDVLAHELVRTFSEDGSSDTCRTATYWFQDNDFDPIACRRSMAGEDDGIVSASWKHYLNDPNGTPRALVESDGTVAALLSRSAWGALGGEQSAEYPIQFPGQYADPECALFYNRFRYYDPGTARYVSPDPLGLEAGIQLYQYAPNPFTWADPYGETKYGGSGKPRQHFILHKSRKCALEAAGPDAEIHSRHRARVPGGQRPHAHPAGAHDDDAENAHHMWGKGKNKLRPGERRRRRSR